MLTTSNCASSFKSAPAAKHCVFPVMTTAFTAASVSKSCRQAAISCKVVLFKALRFSGRFSSISTTPGLGELVLMYIILELLLCSAIDSVLIHQNSDVHWLWSDVPDSSAHNLSGFRLLPDCNSPPFQPDLQAPYIYRLHKRRPYRH